VLVACVLAEGAVRLVFRDVTSTGHTGTWWHQRWTSGVTHNRYGLRERPVPLEKPAGRYRIAVLGDSITYGPGIPAEARYTRQLEQELARRAPPDRRFEVLSFGVPGADTGRELQVARDLVLRFEPDFLLLQWYVNDPMLNDDTGLASGRSLVPPGLARPLRRYSAAFYLVELGWGRLQQALGLRRGFAAYMRQRFGDASAEDWSAAAASLSAFASLCRERALDCGMVLFPQLAGDGAALGFLHDRVLAVCERVGLPCVDLRDVLLGAGEPRELWVNRFDAHPGPRAHALAAEALARELGPLWIRDAAGAPGRH